MPQEFIDASIRVLWPKGKRLAVYQVQALDENRVLHLLDVTRVEAYGLDTPMPRKRASQQRKRASQQRKRK